MIDIQRPDKILIAMYRLSDGTTKSLKYEDIVVKAFELFPEEFALRGYPQYPDASDIHKPLYGPLKRGGHVLSANKMFRLTTKGLTYAERLTGVSGGKAERIDRANSKELERLAESDAFRLFREGQKEQILDTDFFSYLGTTVRTPKNDFIGRLKAVDDAVAAGARFPDNAIYKSIKELHAYLRERFHETVKQKRSE